MIVISSCPSSPISGFLSVSQHFPIENFFSFLDCFLCYARQQQQKKKEAKKSVENNDNKLNKLGKNHFLKVIVGWDERQRAVVVYPFSSLLQSDKHHSIPWTLKYVCRWNTKTTKPQGEGEKKLFNLILYFFFVFSSASQAKRYCNRTERRLMVEKNENKKHNVLQRMA